MYELLIKRGLYHNPPAVSIQARRSRPSRLADGPLCPISTDVAKKVIDFLEKLA